MTTLQPALAAGIGGFGVTELLIILAILMLLFGATKLPALARGLGQSMQEFKKAAKEEEEPKSASAAEAKKPAESSKTHGVN